MPAGPDKRHGLCHIGVMQRGATLDPGLHRRLVDSLYVEAMVMADEARSYFHYSGEEPPMDPLQRVAFTCESLKVTTRLMHVIAWLLSQKAWLRGEIGAAEIGEDKYRLGVSPATDPALVAGFPFAARALIEGSQDLFERVARLQDRMDRMRRPTADEQPSPARALMERLSSAF